MASDTEADILVAGAGVLGVTIAYWVSSLYDCDVVLADSSNAPAMHGSSRNTGVIHRPFYLDPVKKRVFARTSLISHPLWKRLAQSAGLPWKQVGTFNVALEESEVRTIEKYRSWGISNGMDEKELDLLDGRGVSSMEPEVKCSSGLLSRTDVSVDFGAFTRHIWKAVLSRHVRFLGGHRFLSARVRRDVTEAEFRSDEGPHAVRCRYLINAAGGGALSIAHALGLAREYAVMNFRGEYWVVDEPFASRVSSNIYRPPAFPQYPFLDPHFVVRADGSRQIGPNAVMVPGPYIYSGVGLTKLKGLLDGPIRPKARLLTSGDFISLLSREWKSSLSKSAMCDRVRKFVPGLEARMLRRRAVFGVRSSVVGSSGFVPEALVLKGTASAHIINYNSPGATGAPAFSAMVIAELRSAGMLDSFRQKQGDAPIPGWDFESVTARLYAGQRYLLR
ncbi:MAG: FAD-dependent oxidoreductase [Thaumarchaeota archaeon]|nr:FAD-dependent oxidoreductase [Nitrososphaerota archaeon]